MGARPLKTGILVRTPESRGKPTIDPRPPPLPMCNTPHGPRRTSHHPGAALRRGPPRPPRPDPRPIRARFAPIGSEAPADREKWRSGRIVPPRTRRPPRLNRGIMRMAPDVFDVRTRTILPERQNRDRRGRRTIPRTRVDVRRGGRDARPRANTSNRTSFPPVSARGGPGDGRAGDGRRVRARPSGPGAHAAGGLAQERGPGGPLPPGLGGAEVRAQVAQAGGIARLLRANA